MRIHFISIGGAVMHNLALELKANGHEVTGSDDEVYDPSKSRLRSAGLLPDMMGWDAARISTDIDLILLGMHARANNPELLKAQALNLKIQSFPEFIGEHAKDKTQIVVAGSHGKTTTTAMIMHVLQAHDVAFDYLVGAQLDGFDRMVKLSDAKVIVIEGDEYLSSPIDRTPKFMHYEPHYLILTGIQWDHMNVFPTFQSYVNAFSDLLSNLSEKAHVFFDESDVELTALFEKKDWPFNAKGYHAIPYSVDQGRFYFKESKMALGVIGGHNMKNFSAALHVLKSMGLSRESILKAMASFQGAAKRQDLLLDENGVVVYRDFAHAPSKVRATLQGMRELYPNHHLIAACELHTFSSLNKEFLPQYAGALDPADEAIVFYSPKTLENKKMPPLDIEYIKQAFELPTLICLTAANELKKQLLNSTNDIQGPYAILLMSSGTFGGLDLVDVIDKLRL